MVKRSEEEAHAAEKGLGLAVICEILAIEVGCAHEHVLEGDVVYAELPSANIVFGASRVIGGHDGNVLSETAIGDVCPPSPGIGPLGSLIVELEVIGLRIVISLGIRSVGSAECNILIEGILCANGPDLSLIAGAAVAIVGSVFESLVRELTISRAGLQLLALVENLRTSVVGGGIRATIAGQDIVSIRHAEAAAFQAEFYILAEGCLNAGEEAIDYESVIGSAMTPSAASWLTAS